MNVRLTHTDEDLALGYLRYETIRKLNIREFSELHRRNINSGENFDEIVDDLVTRNNK